MLAIYSTTEVFILADCDSHVADNNFDKPVADDGICLVHMAAVSLGLREPKRSFKSRFASFPRNQTLGNVCLKTMDHDQASLLGYWMGIVTTQNVYVEYTNGGLPHEPKMIVPNHKCATWIGVLSFTTSPCDRSRKLVAALDALLQGVNGSTNLIH